MSIREMFNTDTDLESGRGVELIYSDTESIWIHRAGGSNKKFQRVSEEKLKPYSRAIQRGTIDPEVQRDLMRQIYAEAVVIDWKGITDENGEPMECTKENIVKLFEELPDLFADVQEAAQNVANFRMDDREETAKNS